MTQWRVTPTGEREWLGQDGYWYSDEATAARSGVAQSSVPPPPTPPTIYRRPTKKRPAAIGCLVPIAVGIIAAVIFAIASSGGSANIAGTVWSVVPLDGNTVRVYIVWTNHGSKSGSASCVLTTTVYNEFGDVADTEVNSTGTNNSLSPGQTVHQYQDIGVDSGDAANVSAKDVKITNC